MKFRIFGMVAIVAFVVAGLLGRANSTLAQNANDTYSYTLFNVPSSQSTEAFGINNLGVIVGDYTDVNGNTFGFSRSQTGEFTTIEFRPGGTFVSGINNLGHVVGNSPGAAGFLGNATGNITAVIYVPNSRYTVV